MHHIKSYVLRQGKITDSQKQALQQLLPIYGIDYQEHPIDLNQIFGRDNPKIIEIGFGMGDASWQIAYNHPQYDYVGIEVHTPGIGTLLRNIAKNQLNNLRIIYYDALLVLKAMITDHSITAFHIYFPDPWPKLRHQKRRLINAEFIKLLTNKLQTGGYIHIATDCPNYANAILQAAATDNRLVAPSKHNHSIDQIQHYSRPPTKFELRGIKLGYPIADLIFTKS